MFKIKYFFYFLLLGISFNTIISSNSASSSSSSSSSAKLVKNISQAVKSDPLIGSNTSANFDINLISYLEQKLKLMQSGFEKNTLSLFLAYRNFPCIVEESRVHVTKIGDLNPLFKKMLTSGFNSVKVSKEKYEKALGKSQKDQKNNAKQEQNKDKNKKDKDKSEKEKTISFGLFGHLIDHDTKKNPSFRPQAETYPDDSALSYSHIDRTIRLWFPLDYTRSYILIGHDSNITYAKKHDRLPMVVSGDERGIVLFWDTVTKNIFYCSGHETPINSIEFVEDDMFSTNSSDKSLSWLIVRNKLNEIQDINQIGNDPHANARIICSRTLISDAIKAAAI